ncbi:MAG: ATP-binding protein [Actinobacteria bacterium]|nr:ATP-binding protein [Actinomycetota bacterium]
MSSRTFIGEPSCVGLARRFVRETLEAAGQSAACDAALLLTSELATNVVRHAGTSFEIVVEVDDTVRVEIHDGLAVTQAFRDLVEHPPAEVEPTAVGGRGIMLVDKTALRFGLRDKGAGGKAVWFELEVAES